MVKVNGGVFSIWFFSRGRGLVTGFLVPGNGQWGMGLQDVSRLTLYRTQAGAVSATLVFKVYAFGIPVPARGFMPSAFIFLL
ncbi:hypothetical protein A4R26_12035 [Niastella populi]|uniref:Uncharacterized protein n=1 Tax=Niastella populi TaxID=550983 RepID=A0A1V9GB39_9BACT|nr:hypothetical protein A4R26_12035 [Niastella populi]